MPTPRPTITRSELAALQREHELAAERYTVSCAYAHPVAFCEYVGRDKQSGQPLRLAPIHRRYIGELLRPIARILPDLIEGDSGIDFLPLTDRDLVALGSPLSGKTELAMLVALWLMGHMVERGLWPWAWWCGDTKVVAEQRAIEMANVIEGKGESGRAFKRVFPDVGRGEKWSTDGWFISYRGETAPGRDPSIRAAGRDTGVHGGRFHIGIFDDVQTKDNQRLQSSRDSVFTQFVDKVLDRRAHASLAWFLTNAWYEDSSDAKLVAAGWREIKLSAVGPDGELQLPHMWTQVAVEEFMRSPAARLPGRVDRVLRCKRLPAGESSRYKREYVESCYRRGYRIEPGITYRQLPKGARIYTGVDIGGIKKKTASDMSCFFTLMAYGPENIRRVLNVEAGRWNKWEFDAKAKEIHRRYHLTVEGGKVVARHGEFIVEDNAAQAYMAQSMAGAALPVRPHTTGRNKTDEDVGIDAMAGEFAAQLWEIPVDESGLLHPEVESWVTEMIGYSPEKHTGDRHMASWFARMGALEDHEYVALLPEEETAAARKRREERQQGWIGNDPAVHAAQGAEVLWEGIRDALAEFNDGFLDDDGYGVG